MFAGDGFVVIFTSEIFQNAQKNIKNFKKILLLAID